MDELIRGLQAGRAEAFERLVRDFGDRVFRFVRRLIGDRWADDVTQEVFIRVFRSIGRFQGGSFDAWIFTIANRLVIDRVRRREESSLDAAGEGSAPASRDAGPLRQMEDRERQAALLQAVARLPFEQRQVFLLREESGLSFREIAELLDCPLNTALGRMHYAMDALRKALKVYGMS